MKTALALRALALFLFALISSAGTVVWGQVPDQEYHPAAWVKSLSAERLATLEPNLDPANIFLPTYLTVGDGKKGKELSLRVISRRPECYLAYRVVGVPQYRVGVEWHLMYPESVAISSAGFPVWDQGSLLIDISSPKNQGDPEWSGVIPNFALGADEYRIVIPGIQRSGEGNSNTCGLTFSHTEIPSKSVAPTLQTSFGDLIRVITFQDNPVMFQRNWVLGDELDTNTNLVGGQVVLSRSRLFSPQAEVSAYVLNLQTGESRVTVLTQ